MAQSLGQSTVAPGVNDTAESPLRELHGLTLENVSAVNWKQT